MEYLQYYKKFASEQEANAVLNLIINGIPSIPEKINGYIGCWVDKF